MESSPELSSRLTLSHAEKRCGGDRAGGRVAVSEAEEEWHDIGTTRANSGLHFERQGAGSLRFCHQEAVKMTHKEGFVVDVQSMPGNAHDARLLREARERLSSWPTRARTGCG